MSENNNIINKSDEDATVVVKKGDIEQRLHGSDEMKTVMDTINERSSSLFDPELEEILRETEGYELEPQDEDGDGDAYDEPEEPESHADEVVRLQREKRAGKRRTKLIIICCAVAALLAISLALVVSLKNGGAEREYREVFAAAQELYDEGDYDGALEKLREAMELDKTDECLLLMSRCYEAKYDYVNAIAILESSNSGSDKIKSEIERLKKAKEAYDSGQIVVIGGEQYGIDTTTLDLSGKNAGSEALRDIGKLTELTSLKLANNQITDIDFLSGLTKLASLDLSNNKISDITPLSELTSLRTLHLDGNDITDFTPLYGLGGLSMLTITDMEISASQLKELREALPSCIIYSDDATEETVEITLGGKTFKSDVTELDLSDCGISDISLLSACTELKTLDLSGNSITDISTLVDLSKLTQLDLSDNAVSDISPLMSLTKLEYLNLSGNGIRSVTALRNLTALKELNLSGSSPASFAPLSGLTSLKTLYLDGTGLANSDLPELYGLKNLKSLSVRDNSELTASGVDALQKKLTSCSISHSELKSEITLGGKTFASDAETVEAKGLSLGDISEVSGFTAVKNLDLSDNGITDVSPLKGLTTLVALDLSNNRISDVTALSSLTNLKQLWLGGNGLSDEQITALRAALPNCEISA